MDLRIATATWSAIGNGEGGLELASPSLPDPKRFENADVAKLANGSGEPIWYVGWIGKAPDPELVSIWHSTRHADWNDCSASAELIPLKPIEFDPVGFVNPQFHIMQSSRPVINKKRTRALMVVIAKGPNLTSNRRIVLLENHNDLWKVVSYKILDVS